MASSSSRKKPRKDASVDDLQRLLHVGGITQIGLQKLLKQLQNVDVQSITGASRQRLQEANEKGFPASRTHQEHALGSRGALGLGVRRLQQVVGDVGRARQALGISARSSDSTPPTVASQSVALGHRFRRVYSRITHRETGCTCNVSPWISGLAAVWHVDDLSELGDRCRCVLFPR